MHVPEPHRSLHRVVRSGVVWVLVILGTLGSQCFPPILEETLDVYVKFMLNLT